eukprot:scaffold5093_cov179-Ochromonas_danica.AAC.1
MNNSADWDDTVILKVFNEAIHSHRKPGEGNPLPHKKKTVTFANNNINNNDNNDDNNGKHDSSSSNKRKRINCEDFYDLTRNDSVDHFITTSSSSSYQQSHTRHGLIQSNGNGEESTEASQYQDASSAASPVGQQQQTWTGYTAMPSLPSTNNPVMDDALQTMLMAWYQCGYATARYQTLLECGYQPPQALSESVEATGSTSASTTTAMNGSEAEANL